MLVIAIANEKRMAKRWRPNAYIRLFFFSIVVVVDWIAILKFSVVHALSLSLGASVSSSSSISASTLEPTCEIEVSSATARNSTTLSEVGHQQTRHQSPSISTFSSFQFRAEGLRSSFVQNENTVSPSTSGCILPLQKYHMNHNRRDGEMSSRLVNSAGGIEIPNLDFVIQNLHQFNLSVSSMTLLKRSKHPKAQRRRLLHHPNLSIPRFYSAKFATNTGHHDHSQQRFCKSSIAMNIYVLSTNQVES
jgi:hypothetical protein